MGDPEQVTIADVIPATVTPNPTTGKPPRPRRRIPVSLRMFVALLTLLGLGCAWVGMLAYRHLAAIREIEKLGGIVKQTPTGPPWVGELVGKDRMRMFDEVDSVTFRRRATDLVHLRGLTRLQSLTLDNTQVTDAWLVQVRGLTNLQELSLVNTQVTDAGLAHVRGLTNLQELSLINTQVTDAGLAHVRGLTSLQELSLDGTRVTDAGLVHLRGLTRLQTLRLQNTKVTDAGLVHLQGLTRLQLLSLDNTQVNFDGVADLWRAIPGLRISQ